MCCFYINNNFSMSESFVKQIVVQLLQNGVYDSCTNLELQMAVVAKLFCKVAPNICGSSVLSLLHVISLAPKILRWLPDSWEICAPWSICNLKCLIYTFWKLFDIVIDLLLTSVLISEYYCPSVATWLHIADKDNFIFRPLSDLYAVVYVKLNSDTISFLKRNLSCRKVLTGVVQKGVDWCREERCWLVSCRKVLTGVQKGVDCWRAYQILLQLECSSRYRKTKFVTL